MEPGARPDQIDKMVYTETYGIRRLYYQACRNLHIPARELTPVTLMQRSVPEGDPQCAE